MRTIWLLILALALFAGGANADGIGGHTVAGHTRLQLRQDTLGLVTVTLKDITGGGAAYSAKANPDGSWALLGVPDGVYTLRADAPFYLPTQGVVAVSGSDVALGRNVLLVGDLNDSGGINAADFSALASNWMKQTQPWR